MEVDTNASADACRRLESVDAAQVQSVVDAAGKSIATVEVTEKDEADACRVQEALEALRAILDNHGETTILRNLSAEHHYTVMKLQGLSSRLEVQARATTTFRELLNFGGSKATMHEVSTQDLNDQRMSAGMAKGLSDCPDACFLHGEGRP